MGKIVQGKNCLRDPREPDKINAILEDPCLVVNTNTNNLVSHIVFVVTFVDIWLRKNKSF